MNVDNLNIKNLKGIEYFTSLGTLFCERNNLSTIDLSNNTDLWRLFCSENKIMSLDITKNIELQTIDCGSNQINNLENQTRELEKRYGISEKDSFVNNNPAKQVYDSLRQRI